MPHIFSEIISVIFYAVHYGIVLGCYHGPYSTNSQRWKQDTFHPATNGVNRCHSKNTAHTFLHTLFRASTVSK